MKLDILAAFNNNSRRLIRIWRSWGLVGAKKRKQGAAQVVLGVRQICKNMKIRKKVGKWVGSGRGSSRLVQNDQRSCRNVFKQVLAKDSLKKQWKNMIFRFISRPPPPPPPRRSPRRRPLSTPVWGPLLGLFMFFQWDFRPRL